MEMEICETGVLKHHEMTSPATGYSSHSLHTHTQHSLCLYINLPNSLRSSPPYIIISYVFHRKGGKRLIVGYLLKEKAYVRIYSAVQQSWRELLLKQSNRALFEKNLELLVIANATVFPRPNLLFLYPPVLCM